MKELLIYQLKFSELLKNGLSGKRSSTFKLKLGNDKLNIKKRIRACSFRHKTAELN